MKQIFHTLGGLAHRVLPVACALFALSCSITATAAATYTFDTQAGKYTYTYPYYIVDAASGDTTLATASITYVADAETDPVTMGYAAFYAATTGTLFKTGTGELTIDTGLTNWIGNMHVMGGVMHVKHVDGFGLSSGKNEIYIHNGATLVNETPTGIRKLDANGYSCRRTIAFEGTGYDNRGALRVINDIKGDTTWPLMCYLSLTGDGTLVMDNATSVYMNWRPPSQLRLNGHSLTIKNAENRDRPQFRLNISNYVVPAVTYGHILVDGADFALQADDSFDNVNKGSITFTNKSSFTFSCQVAGQGARTWPIYIQSTLERWSLGNNNQNTQDVFWAWNAAVTNQNNWNGPIHLTGDIPLFNPLAVKAHHTGLTLNGPVSGTGGFRPFKSSNRKYFGDLALQLNSRENSFTGGVVLGDGGRLILRGNGSLPKAGAGASITNGSLILCGTDTLDLPTLTFHGTGLVERTAWDGGTADKIVKTGAGALVWETSVGAAELNLQGGSFVYPAVVPDYSLVAGLFEYTNAYTSANFFDGTAYRVADRPRQLYPRVAYNNGWVINGPLYGTDPNNQYLDAGQVNRIYSYRGYIWNRDSTNVTWSMVSVMDKGARVIIDDTIVVDQTALNNKGAMDPSYSRNHAKTGTITLTPGAHTFEFRYFCTSGNAGATGMAYGPAVFSYIDDEFFPTNSLGTHNSPAAGENGGLWTNNMGFGIDRQARRSHVYTDYEKAIDTGNGRLFTTSTNSVEISRATPHFTTITAAPGTSLDLNTREVTLANLTGLPNLFNGSLTVTGTWTIPGADVAAGAVLGGTGSFALTADTQIQLADTAALPRTSFTLVTTTGNVSIPATFNGKRLDARGRYRLVVEGNTLGATYHCGTKVILR